jgi:hypothetical protein
MPGREPLPELPTGRAGGVGARESAGAKAEPFGLAPYCFFKAFVGSHGSRLHRSVRFPQEFQCFNRSSQSQ